MRVTVLLTLNPVTAGILGSLLLHEAVDRWRVAATMLIGVGLGWLREGRDDAGQESHLPESKTGPQHGRRGTAEAGQHQIS